MNIVQIKERSGLREYSRDIQGTDPSDQPGTDPAAGLVHCEHPLGGSGLRCIGGSIYNYFDSKAELVGATVESVWCEIFHLPDNEAVFRDTEACVTWMYERMEYGCRQYPGFFTLHSLGFMREEKSDGKRRMQQTWQHILDGLCLVLKRDTRVRPDAFTDQFTEEKFADVLFSLMLSALLRQDYDPTAVLEIVRRTLY